MGFCCLQFPLFGLLVKDDFGFSVPVAWVIMGDTESEDAICAWLQPLIDRMSQAAGDPDWTPGAAMADCSAAEAGAIK